MSKEYSIGVGIKPYGIDWFDKIVQEDKILQNATARFDLKTMDSRLDELEAKYNIKRVASTPK